MIGASLVRGLRDEGYSVDWARDGRSATTALVNPEAAYLLALLDWNLPDGDGLSVLKALRSRGATLPVLMITARDAVDDRVLGLDSGADDYLVKPFSLDELKARIRVLLRRHAQRADARIVHGTLTLDPLTHSATLGERKVPLRPREYALLHALLERPGAVLSRNQLEERMYSWDDGVESNVVEVMIHNVRRKLGNHIIENLRGVGWRIADAP